MSIGCDQTECLATNKSAAPYPRKTVHSISRCSVSRTSPCRHQALLFKEDMHCPSLMGESATLPSLARSAAVACVATCSRWRLKSSSSLCLRSPCLVHELLCLHNRHRHVPQTLQLCIQLRTFNMSKDSLGTHLQNARGSTDPHNSATMSTRNDRWSFVSTRKT